jgi:hypothetical protein
VHNDFIRCTRNEFDKFKKDLDNYETFSQKLTQKLADNPDQKYIYFYRIKPMSPLFYKKEEEAIAKTSKDLAKTAIKHAAVELDWDSSTMEMIKEIKDKFPEEVKVVNYQPMEKNSTPAVTIEEKTESFNYFLGKKPIIPSLLFMHENKFLNVVNDLNPIAIKTKLNSLEISNNLNSIKISKSLDFSRKLLELEKHYVKINAIESKEINSQTESARSKDIGIQTITLPRHGKYSQTGISFENVSLQTETFQDSKDVLTQTEFEEIQPIIIEEPNTFSPCFEESVSYPTDVFEEMVKSYETGPTVSNINSELQSTYWDEKERLAIETATNAGYDFNYVMEIYEPIIKGDIGINNQNYGGLGDLYPQRNTKDACISYLIHNFSESHEKLLKLNNDFVRISNQSAEQIELETQNIFLSNPIYSDWYNGIKTQAKILGENGDLQGLLDYEESIKYFDDAGAGVSIVKKEIVALEDKLKEENEPKGPRI